LELSWEALEDAGIAPESLRGSRTGVFFGAMWADYEKRHTLGSIGPHSGTGWHLGVVPGRISYCFGLRGPSLAINTACSSSLVAVDLARRSLQSGETDLAVVGGVSLMLAPHVAIAMSQFGGTSANSRGRAFDAGADGYVRGEGGGVVVLRRVGDARAASDRLYCVIRGSAVNNDGASAGLTTPSGEAQVELLREAYGSAGVEPHHVDFVEAHGTGKFDAAIS
jgi:acyl transferase domain-containing protein